jgi:pimeloyl-ACP methyl ester carboxylesterase
VCFYLSSLDSTDQLNLFELSPSEGGFQVSNIDISLLNANHSYTGLVGSTNPFDLYQFSLSQPGSFNFSLNGLSANADIQLLNSSETLLYSSSLSGTTPETININDLAPGSYSVRVFQVDGDTNYQLDVASTGNTQRVAAVDPVTGMSVVQVNPVSALMESATSANPFDSGVFTVGESGEVGIDFLFDGGVYQGELAIFSLEKMDNFELGSEAFIQEATRRALSDSSLGHVVISDLTEGARFHGFLGEGDQNSGIYQGVKTFSMRPGDEFGLLIVPKGTVQQVFNNPFVGGAMRPLFSLSTANPNDAFQVGQIADVIGDGKTFVMEDLRVDSGSDKDYNDFIFQVRGATGTAVGLNKVIDPVKDWRGTDLGKALIEYAKPYVTPNNPSVGELVSNDLINTVLGNAGSSAIKSDGEGAIAQPSVKPEVTVAEVTTETVNSTSGETETVSTTQPLVEEAFVATNFLVNEWLSNISKDLAGIEASNNQMLEQFKSELVEADDHLSNLASNFWGKYNSAQSKTFDQLSNTENALNNTQTSLNQLRLTISDAASSMFDQQRSLNSYIISKGNTAISSENGLHTAISNANSQMYSLYSNLVDEFNRNGGTYPDVWKQVHALNDYRSNEIGKDWGEYNTIQKDRQTLFNNTWNSYDTLLDYRLTVTSDANNKYNASANILDEAWSQYYALRNHRTTILDNALNEYYELNDQRWQVIGDAWNDYFTLKNSWNEWVGDTKDEIKTWAKVLSDSEALFSSTENPWSEKPNSQPKVGLPLVGIIDTGFAANNPDIDYSRITLGKDLVGGDDNPLLESWEWWRDDHGTKMLEVIAATRNNDIGIDGINDKSPLWLGSAVGSKNWAQSLIEFVDAAKKSGQPNAVVNLSFDLTQTNPDGSVTTRYELTSLERAALTYAQRNNVLVVAAAGNQGGTMSALGQAVKEFDNIITVGAAEGWNRADYSSYGEVDYDNYGKGVDILAQGNASNGASGSSVAAAKVTGAVSLMWAANPNLNYTQVVDILRRTATDLDTPGWDITTGLGLLNIAAAVFLAKATEAEVYTPRGFDLVQNTLKTYNIPEVYWPEFYKAYYYYDLEPKLGRSVWSDEFGAVASERATRDDEVPGTRIDVKLGSDFLNAATARMKLFEAQDRAKRAIQGRSIDQRYQRYVIRKRDVYADWWPNPKIKEEWWLVIETDEKLRDAILAEERAKQKRDTDLAKVNAIKEKLKALEQETQLKINALKTELAAVEAALKEETSNTQGGMTAKGEELKKKVKELKAKIATLQAASQQEIDDLKLELEVAEKSLQQSTQDYAAAIAETQRLTQERLERIRREQEAAKKGFFDRLSDSVKQFSKDISEKIKSNLEGVDVGAVLNVLKKIPVVGTVVNGIEGLIALIGGDWKTVVEKGIKAALGLVPGGGQVPDPVVDILVKVGWAIVVDKKYDQALKDILIKNLNFVDKLPNGKYVADVFVDVAWKMKDGDWKNVLSAGLSGAGFGNADKFVDLAWGIKDGDYKKALNAGLSAAGFSNANKFVELASAFVDNNYEAALSAGLEATGLQNAGAFVKNTFSAIQDNYSLPGQSIDPTAIPQKHKQYEYLARGIAYEDPEVSAIAEDAFKDDRTSGNKLAVHEELLDKSYKVDQIISHPSSGFYAVGLVSTDGKKPPVLAVRGTGGSPTERKGPALLKDVLEDANPLGIGYGQFQANKNEIEAWLVAQNSKGQRPDIVGHSLGGALAQTISAEFADQVGETVTFNSPGIETSTVLKFGLNGGKPENVTHYVVSGDIVQMAGEAFLPGQAVLCSYSNPFVWEKHGLAVLNGAEIKGEQKASGVKFSSLSVLDFSNPTFHYRELDYTLFLAALGLVSPYVSTSLSTRGTAEANRKAIGAFLNSNFQTIQSWVDTAWSIKNGDYLNALSTGFDLANFQDGKKWVDLVQSVKSGDYLNALSTGFDVAKFQQGKDWVDMAWALQKGDYLKTLSTGFKVAGFPEGEHLAKAAMELREGDYLDAFFEGMHIVPGVGDLVNAFKAVGDMDFKGVANSLAKVATNKELLDLLVKAS